MLPLRFSDPLHFNANPEFADPDPEFADPDPGTVLYPDPT